MQMIKKLPAVFQTVTEKKFFDATFDQVFSKKDSDLLNGFLGQRIPGRYNPLNDFYLPEPSKNRTWWQLEATAFARDTDNTKTNVFFYEDLLDRINYYGGNTLNQDRLFESEYYSWAPPIDFDMFTNYQSYYWVKQGLEPISITGVESSEIIGQQTFTTPSDATPPNLKLSTGMTIILEDDADPVPLIVEYMGNCEGIQLVPEFGDATTAADYITIERGATDRNAWSRSNKWFHADVIRETAAITGVQFPVDATRALRPIIQFVANLPLYKSGIQFNSDITFGFRTDIFGNPLLLSQLQGKTVSQIQTEIGVTIANGNLCVFALDESIVGSNTDPVCAYLYSADTTGPTVVFTEYPTSSSAMTPGDIVIPTSDAPYAGMKIGETWYFEDNAWYEAANEKTSANQPPLFQLFDHNKIPLDDEDEYPESNFAGSKIFSYKVSTVPGATPDSVLGFPIVYTSLGQASDIIFQNNLITDRYTYGLRLPIDGYYYYNINQGPSYYNDWNLHTPCNCVENVDIGEPEVSKQRVVDRYVVGYGTEYQFKLSVSPVGYPSTPDLIVSVNSTEIRNSTEQSDGYTISVINGAIYVNLEDYLTNLFLLKQAVPPVVEILTYTHDMLDPLATGYYEIPQQLEANPSQLEISEISASNLIEQFSSIITNQKGFRGTAFGGSNNYRDSAKDRSLGSFILQNLAPALKTMLVSSTNDLDVIEAIRFSQDEYTKFKNKYLRTALQLINREFNPVQYQTNTIVISNWVEEIMKTVNISKEFSNAFAYSYMIANGGATYNEEHTVPVSGPLTLTNYIDLSDLRNAMYIYDVTGQERLMLVGIDYDYVSTGTTIEVEFKTVVPTGNDIYVALYVNPPAAYIPSTPSKLGTYSVFVPRIETDNSYAVPKDVIIGHDGSKTVAYGDYRDQLLLELERRIYNLIQTKYRDDYYLPLRVQSVQTGYFRETRYSREEYLDITESYLNKWSAKNKANYRVNEWDIFSQVTPSQDLWKLYNYSKAVNTSGVKLNLPGNWKGIFQYCYDTIYPNTRPWEMLGFSIKPTWWETRYGSDWSASNTYLWDDLEAGIIAEGNSAIFDPVSNSALPQEMWARPGLSSIIPVDNAGQIRSVIDIFSVRTSGDPELPFDGFNDDWVYGDGAPVEQAWMSTSGYAFSLQEFMYLMRPAPFGELLWDTYGTERSPGRTFNYGYVGFPLINSNWQYVQNDIYESTDPFFKWMRPKNKDQEVHGESVDNVVRLRFGYQRWISDRIMYLGKDVTSVFGQKVRTLDVNLANKLAGFTNKDTTSTYIESITPGAVASNLLIPTNNFDVFLHKSQPIKTYSYSGVVVRALENGQFAVYGYDLLRSEFIVLDRSTENQQEITIGGTPAEFRIYTVGDTYLPGEIVRYNGVYYTSKVTLVAAKFNPNDWTKLRSLPITGGITVMYSPKSKNTFTRVPYGSVLNSVQEVFDLLIGWGAYLETQGWKFDDVNADTNQVSDWLYSGKQFLYWLNTSWAPDASIQLSPAANSATLTVEAGYPDDVETLTNGVYSILNKFGVAIPPSDTATDRTGLTINVSPVTLDAGGIYFLQINSSETEHILIFDNVTSFNDVLYNPLLRARQQRLRFNGFRSNGWYGKMEAPGYLIIENQLVPNFDTIVNAMKYYYDPDVTIDNPSLEDLGRHLIGYESKSYLDNLQVSNDVQYLFYQGAIRQKGTSQAFDKLFRSTKVQSNDAIKVYEEWALKLGDFGNTIEQVSTEFILNPEQNSNEIIVARLNFIPSPIGFVKQIDILNAENTYTVVPKIIISAPDAAPDGWAIFSSSATYTTGNVVRYDSPQGNPNYYVYSGPIPYTPGAFDPAEWTLVLATRQARAYAVLDSTGIISRIDMTDPGYGYVEAPFVSIDSGLQPNQLDKLYAVWQGEIKRDTAVDNIIEIDVDDTLQWTVRPNDPARSLEFPTVKVSSNVLPTSGYVNFNDVRWTSFDVSQTALNWGSAALNPVANDTVWVAKTFTEDWDVYKLVNIAASPMTPNPWKVVPDAAGNLLLITTYDADPLLNVTITPQFSADTVTRTDFGNMICLQIKDANGDVSGDTNYTVGFVDAGQYTDPESLDVYNSYSLVTLEGNPISSSDIGAYADFTTLLLFKTMRWFSQPSEPVLPIYVGLGDLIWVDDIGGKWSVLKIQADPGYWDITQWDVEIPQFWGQALLPNALINEIAYGWDVTGPMFFAPYRVEEPLINTKLFSSAQVFQSRTQNELVLMPVYDPAKYILPGLAKQNITFTSLQDPARYNVTGNTRLFSENIVFDQLQVGKLWWDLSTIRYTYYEQPMALDGSETETTNLVYRRDHWGQIFPGSTVDIYEWTMSSVPPAEYTGTGVPRSTTDYVQITQSNRFTNITETKYFFWVLAPTDKPNIENRTLAASEVARLLLNPKGQGFVFFAPIQQTATNNSYMFYNSQETLIRQGNSVQIQYRLDERDDQEHAQWAFFREGDASSLVTDQFWDKMVDSLCGYTRLLPPSDEWRNGIFIANNLPWDIFGWDIDLWDSATTTDSPIYGEILPVPDPNLSVEEKYGIEYRPRQSMFTNIYNARKIFVQAANALLLHIPIRDDDANWNYAVDSDTYWKYVNWYEIGYEGVTPTAVFETLALAQAALSAGLLETDTIVEVSDGTGDGRFVLYVVMELTSTSGQSFKKIGIELSAIQLLNTIYTVKNKYQLVQELRQLLNALRTTVFVDIFLVDQNELFFSMLNFVVSEQKNPNWLFKSSYIYIKETNLPLTQDSLYVSDNVDNVVNYIMDAKPYHTQIRDYTTGYTTSDLAYGTAADSMKSKTTITFGPRDRVEVDTYSYVLGTALLSQNIDQFVSQENVYTIPLTTPDPSKKGYSELYPYTFNFNSLNINNPQSFITPQNVVSVQIGDTILIYGQDYYVEYNNDGTYTAYFYSDPSGGTTPVALVLWDAGQLSAITYDTYRNETAYGFPKDNFVVNVDTQLPVGRANGILVPYVGWGDVWDELDDVVGDIIINNGGSNEIPWDVEPILEILPNTLSNKENLDDGVSPKFYRNARRYSGALGLALPAPRATSTNLQTATIFVNPASHPLGTDILPQPSGPDDPGVVWIDGERIEYEAKTLVSPNVWRISKIRRGTDGTCPTAHDVAAVVWVEKGNVFADQSGSNIKAWNVLDNSQQTAARPAGQYTDLDGTPPLGGLWYSRTDQALFLKQEQGRFIP